MSEYRLYYLDRNSHVIGREEFVAGDDTAALLTAASLHEESERTHSGLMLWQGARQVFATDEISTALVVLSAAAAERA
jgi:hypothetical protein